MAMCRDANIMVKNEGCPEIDRGSCKGCGRCVAACMDRLISLETDGVKKIAIVGDCERCNLCGKCVEECLYGAISLRIMPGGAR